MICHLFDHSPVYRVGGDEFVVTLEGVDYANRFRIMSELDSTVEENNMTGGVVVAAGISDYNSETDLSFHQVFERADRLMYERKSELKSKKA